jgi:hypothetical protein
MAYFFARAAAVMVGEQAEYARVGRVSGEFFHVFGVQPTAGRWFDTEEIKPGPPTAAIVSAAFAQSHFGGAREAIGRAIRLARSWGWLRRISPSRNEPRFGLRCRFPTWQILSAGVVRISGPWHASRVESVWNRPSRT